MKKLSIFLALLIALGSVSPVLALEETRTDIKSVKAEFEAKKIEIQNKIKENKDRIDEARGEVRVENQEDKQRRDEDSQNRVNGAKVRLEVAVRVFEATIKRLDTLTGRIDSKLTELNGRGASTTVATTFVTAAKADLANAKTHIETLRLVDLSIGSTSATSTGTTTLATNIKVSFDKIKSEAKIIRESLVSAKQNLMRALTAIKKMENVLRKESKDVPDATTTDTTSTL